MRFSYKIHNLEKLTVGNNMQMTLLVSYKSVQYAREYGLQTVINTAMLVPRFHSSSNQEPVPYF
jgi:hypothetical protein